MDRLSKDNYTYILLESLIELTYLLHNQSNIINETNKSNAANKAMIMISNEPETKSKIYNLIKGISRNIELFELQFFRFS